MTVAGSLKNQGYLTGIIGKWHLNFNYTDVNTGEVLKRKGKKSLAPVGRGIPDGPIIRGFDYYHGFQSGTGITVNIRNADLASTGLNIDAFGGLIPFEARLGGSFFESFTDFRLMTTEVLA